MHRDTFEYQYHREIGHDTPRPEHFLANRNAASNAGLSASWVIPAYIDDIPPAGQSNSGCTIDVCFHERLLRVNRFSFMM